MSEQHKSRRRHHRDWKKRFYVTAGALLTVNVVLLFLLAQSYLQPLQAFETTKQDAQLMAELLGGQYHEDELMEALMKRFPDRKLRWQNQQLSVGGVNFYRDEKGRIVRVEHWSKPGN